MGAKFIGSGGDAVGAAARALVLKHRSAAKIALRSEGEAVKTASMENTPVDLGALKGSHVVSIEETASTIAVHIGVGGPAAPYAEAVHEHLSEHSPPSWKAAEAAGRPVQFSEGGPKFLERAMNERERGMDQRIGDAIAAIVRSGSP